MNENDTFLKSPNESATTSITKAIQKQRNKSERAQQDLTHYFIVNKY